MTLSSTSAAIFCVFTPLTAQSLKSPLSGQLDIDMALLWALLPSQDITALISQANLLSLSPPGHVRQHLHPRLPCADTSTEHPVIPKTSSFLSKSRPYLFQSPMSGPVLYFQKFVKLPFEFLIATSKPNLHFFKTNYPPHAAVCHCYHTAPRPLDKHVAPTFDSSLWLSF